MSQFFTKPILTPFTNAMQQALRAAVKRLNLVTREEFDIQAQLLQKTKIRVQQLEQELIELQEH